MRNLAPLSVTLLLAACGTIVGQKTFHVPIDSVPQGAVVAYRDANVGVTPCTVVMTRTCSQVTLRKEGFHDQVVEVGARTSGWIVGNLLFGGPVGVAIDAAGGARRLKQAPCWVELVPSHEERPGVWQRPAADAAGPYAVDEDEGWVREGTTLPTRADEQPNRPTRAGPWTPPPETPVAEDEQGWVRHGSGN